MTPHEMTPHEYMEKANRHFDAGEKRLGSKCVWLAVWNALAAIAGQRGLPFRDEKDAFELVVKLDREDGYTREQIGNYAVAEEFLDNSREVWEETNFDLSLYHWDDDGFEMCLPIAEEFVDYLVKKAGKDASNSDLR